MTNHRKSISQIKHLASIEKKLLVNEAMVHVKNENYYKALGLYNKALDLEPNDNNALIARSKCHLLLGEPQKALQDAENALQFKMKNVSMANAVYCKAEALYYLNNFEMSLVYYYRGMRIRPEYGQFRLGVQKAKNAIQNILRKN
ncbi:outer dynein arm-docking complex subunit 4 isoform X2 [Frieseomelitta varia]|uniref:outer dynein arm-docking complex subunit 4 isoform X2 n=1 Tax=Frieseomelitta varia TaxID=561572 RepID=UPI001CB68F7D|nr:outer dynein arm-docking complex subunit 4 isoform X2 [Frieseomelitta varia]